ncbi:MAG: segregation/condensation protein A [Planctomycetales bacterium]|nr:segregation/condensation protein A [Planctomycetales bacterium]
MSFRVDLTSYRGPLDLLLYLVRKHEVDIADIPIAEITDQYLGYIAVLEQIDVNDVGDFLEVASLLIEIKARMVLPQTVDEEPEVADPRQELVERLLEYKKYKDVSSILEEQSRRWQQSYPRLANDLPTRRVDPADQPIHEVELWDLVSALGRVMREHEIAQPSNIVYDDTPIHVFMRQIHEELRTRDRMAISEVYQAGMRKSTVIGVFLAVLELVRHHNVVAEQDELSGEIWVRPGEEFDAAIDLSTVDDYDGASAD